MRLIDADALEREGWKLHRNYQQDENVMVYEVKALSEIQTVQPDVPYINDGDTVYRQAAIDATWEEPTYTDPINVLTEIRDRIKALPSAEPEIIRCKDCLHNHDCNIQYHAQAGEEFYCGAAERRNDEQDD